MATIEQLNEKYQSRSEFAKKLDKVRGFITWRYVAYTYFGKSATWLNFKLRGIDGNGKVTDFTDEEKQTMRNALCDIADILRRTADSLLDE